MNVGKFNQFQAKCPFCALCKVICYLLVSSSFGTTFREKVVK